MSTPEQKTQLAIIEWLKKQHPEVSQYVVKIDNEGKRSVGGHMLALRMGLHKGASDLFIAWPTDKYHGLWLEIKSDVWRGAQGKKAKLHYETQLNFIEKMKAVGFYGEIGAGVDQCIKIISDYLNVS